MPKNLQRAQLFVMICHASDCKKRGAKALTNAAKSELKEAGVFKQSRIIKMRCTGNCKRAPICGLLPSNTWMERAEEQDLREAIRHDIKALKL